MHHRYDCFQINKYNLNPFLYVLFLIQPDAVSYIVLDQLLRVSQTPIMCLGWCKMISSLSRIAKKVFLSEIT